MIAHFKLRALMKGLEERFEGLVTHCARASDTYERDAEGILERAYVAEFEDFKQFYYQLSEHRYSVLL